MRAYKSKFGTFQICMNRRSSEGSSRGLIESGAALATPLLMAFLTTIPVVEATRSRTRPPSGTADGVVRTSMFVCVTVTTRCACLQNHIPIPTQERRLSLAKHAQSAVGKPKIDVFATPGGSRGGSCPGALRTKRVPALQKRRVVCHSKSPRRRRHSIWSMPHLSTRHLGATRHVRKGRRSAA